MKLRDELMRGVLSDRWQEDLYDLRREWKRRAKIRWAVTWIIECAFCLVVVGGGLYCLFRYALHH